METDVSSERVFRAIVQAYDLAIARAEKPVDKHQRSMDLFYFITEYNKQFEAEREMQRERRKKAMEKKSQHEAILIEESSKPKTKRKRRS